MSHPEFTRRGFLQSTGLAMAGTAAMTMGLPGLARASGAGQTRDLALQNLFLEEGSGVEALSWQDRFV